MVAMGAMLLFFAAMANVAVPAPERGAPRAPAAAEERGEAAATTTHPHGQAAALPDAVDDHPPIALPIAGIDRSQIRNSWGDPRDNGLREHHGTDIPAPEGTPVLAAAPGTVEKLFYSNGGGGITVYIRSPDRKWSYYYAHLQGYAPGLHEGQVVAAGEMIAFVGDTGNAGAGNFHLHFGISRMQPGDGWWQGEAVNPWRLLTGDAPRTGGG